MIVFESSSGQDKTITHKIFKFTLLIISLKEHLCLSKVKKETHSVTGEYQ